MSPDTMKTVRRLKVTRSALLLTLILYIAVTLIINSSYLTVDRLMRLRSNVIFALGNGEEGSHRLEPEDTVAVELFQDGYAVLTRNGLSVRGGGGNEYSSHTLQYKNPCMKVCEKYILCFDRGGVEWTLFNSFRALCSGTENGNIINGSVDESGYFSIASEREDAKGCVTVYNDEGVALTRWNSKHYLLDSFFMKKNTLAVVSLASEREKTNTVFTVFNYKNGEVSASVTSPDTFPLAMARKEDGSVEVLTDSGALLFNGEEILQTHTYPEPSPGVFYQGEEATMLSYHTASGVSLVECFSPTGEMRFIADYPSVLSLGCSGDYYFVLTTTDLYILDSSGKQIEQRAVTAAEVLVSPEISLLCGASSVDPLDLSSLP